MKKKSWVKHQEQYKPLNSKEMQDFEKLYALHCFIKNSETLDGRLRELHVYKYLKPAVGLIRKVIQAVFDSIPDKQLDHMNNVREKYFVYIQPKPVIGSLPDEVVLKRADLQLLCESAARDKCALCMAEGGEKRECRYRGMFLQFAPPGKVVKEGLCEYALMKVKDEEFFGMKLNENETEGEEE